MSSIVVPFPPSPSYPSAYYPSHPNMRKENRHNYRPVKGPFYTKPLVIKSPRSSVILVEPAKTDLLKGEVLPPWMQPVYLSLSDRPNSGMQVTEMWTHSMRKSVVKDLFPKRVKSKVAQTFHEYYHSEGQKKIFRRFSRRLPEDALSDRSPELESPLDSPAAHSKTISSNSPEPEHISSRFPPIRSVKKIKKPWVEIGRPSVR